MKLKYIVKNNDNYQTINQILQSEFNISTRLFSKLTKNNLVLLNNSIVDTRKSIKSGDVITINLNSFEDNSNIVPIKMNLDIIYEDKWLLIINKPAGMPIHPSPNNFNNTLSNGIKYYFDSINLQKKIRPVNRLDINTSGLVVFAKCEYIHYTLSKQMETNNFKKKYYALVNGFLENKSGTINLPISRKPNSIIERCINNNGQKAITDYKVLKEFNTYSLIECTLQTGRTHQIRVHMKSIGHPILGDTLYGTSSNLINRQALHSYYISFVHPVTKKVLTFKTDIPKDFKILK